MGIKQVLAAIDGDSDELLNTSKNTTNGVNLVDAEYYYLSNRLGSISAILDADNQDRILEYYRYEVFGSATVLPIVDVSPVDGLEDTPLDLNDNNTAGPALVSSFGNTYLYTARRFDDVTGLYYYRYRYYDARTGRFICRDPAKSPWSNLYHYVNNQPSKFMDPSGLEKTIFTLCVQRCNEVFSLPIIGKDEFMVRQGCYRRCLFWDGKQDDTKKAKLGDDASPLEKKGWEYAALLLYYVSLAYNDNTDWLSELPNCPCENPDKDGIKSNDGWASEGKGKGFYAKYHFGAYECFRSYPTKDNELKLGGPGQQCCYDSCGKLITSGSGAGTPDKVGTAVGETDAGEASYLSGDEDEYGAHGSFSGLVRVLSHVEQDVNPWETMGWELYNRYWVPNNGNDCDKNHVE